MCLYYLLRSEIMGKFTFAACLTSLLICACGDDASPGDSADTTGPIELTANFVRADPAAESPSGHTQIDSCSTDGETWAGAEASVNIVQDSDRTEIRIEISGAAPNTLFTAWLRLRGTNPDTGESYGGNPITDKGSTALAPSTALAELAAIAETEGATDAANALTTDADGNGTLEVVLDFAMIGGAYPFERYDSALLPVGIVGAPDAPFMIRLASHCTDGLAHGLLQGDREMWFNWAP